MKAQWLLAVALIVGTACGATRTGAAPQTISPSPTVRDEGTKPPGINTTQPQLPLPTRVRWAVDRQSGTALLVLFADGMAQGYRIIDASGATVLRVPISGSGIFSAETCMARLNQGQEQATWMRVDDTTLEQFMRSAANYRVEVDGVPQGRATVPLIDTGCRSST